MYCDRCGFENWNNSKYCRKCGNILTRAEAEDVKQHGNEEHDEPSAPEPRKVGNKRIPLILASLAVLAAVIGGTIYATRESEPKKQEASELYLPIEYVYTSKWNDEEEETTRTKYTYYFDGLTIYSSYDNNLNITTYKEDGSIEKDEYYHIFSDNDISHSITSYFYNDNGQRIKYAHSYDNIYNGEHHLTTEEKKYEFSGSDTNGKLIKISKSEYGEEVDVSFVLNEDNKIVKETDVSSTQTKVYEYQYDDNGNESQYRSYTYENDELISNSIRDSEYDENGNTIKTVYKSYDNGKLTYTDTTEFHNNPPYVYSTHSESKGTSYTSVSDFLTNRAKAEIKDGAIVPAETSSFREMDEAELKDALKIIDKFEALEKSAK